MGECVLPLSSINRLQFSHEENSDVYLETSIENYFIYRMMVIYVIASRLGSVIT
jgi:hypothetical protein